MKYTGSMTRMQARELPGREMRCNLEKFCVYRQNRLCDDPRNNKGNGDAACHKMGNRAIYEKLEYPGAALCGR